MPADPALATHTKPFVSNVEVVLVPVTVTDPMTRLVPNLSKKHFKVFEDGHEQPIEFFYTQDAPVSVGMIFDESGSMKGALDVSREAAAKFMDASNLDDEYFLITFSSKPGLPGEFTSNPGDIQGRLIDTMPGGWTALWDAVYLGLNKMRSAKYPRKVLVIFSDGGENHSRYNFTEMRRIVRESDVQIYGVAIPGADYGPGTLFGISGETGGRTLVGPPESFADKLTRLAIELRNQYVLGYRSHTAHDGRFHKLKVKVLPPLGLPPLTVDARKSGYYAPEL